MCQLAISIWRLLIDYNFSISIVHIPESKILWPTVALVSYPLITLCMHTLSGHIGKVVASDAAVARSSPAEVALIYTMHVALKGYCP